MYNATDRLIQRVREELGKPVLEPGILLQKLTDTNQFYMSQMRNISNEGIYLDRFPLAVVAGTNEYPLQALAPAFGGAFLVTTDPSLYDDGREREITVVRVQDFDLTGAPYLAQGVGDANDSLAALAFFFNARTSQWIAKTMPRDATGFYTVWFEPDGLGELSLMNPPAMPPSYHTLLVTTTALLLLPLCKWQGDETKRPDVKLLMTTLSASKAMWEREFDTYVRNKDAQHTGVKEAYESTPGFWSSFRGGGG